MNCIEQITGIARRLQYIIADDLLAYSIPTDEYGWENHRYVSPKFRLGHVELFLQENFAVVHVCVFPHETDPSPIFGFDVIAGRDKITGVFLDLSPVQEPVVPFIKIAVASNRERPEWGDIFSDHWLACRPTADDMTKIGLESERLLTEYLKALGKNGNRDLIIARQNRYCTQQQKNPHTRRALVKLLGDAGAEHFMSTILFPEIPTTAHK